MLQKILELYPDYEFLIADGFDDAIIGIDEKDMRIIYSYNKCIDILSKNMDKESAEEYFYFNVQDAHVGENTPIYCMDDISDL